MFVCLWYLMQQRMARNFWIRSWWLLMMILGSFWSQLISSSEFVLIVDHRPNYNNDSATTILLQSHKPGSWPGNFCKRISEDAETITIMCELFQPLVFVKTDANGDQTKVVTTKMEYRGLPNIKIPPTPKIWDGRRHQGHVKAFMDNFFTQEAFMAREERFHKRLQFAKLEYRVANVHETKEEQMPYDMYIKQESYI